MGFKTLCESLHVVIHFNYYNTKLIIFKYTPFYSFFAFFIWTYKCKKKKTFFLLAIQMLIRWGWAIQIFFFPCQIHYDILIQTFTSKQLSSRLPSNCLSDCTVIVFCETFGSSEWLQAWVTVTLTEIREWHINLYWYIGDLLLYISWFTQCLQSNRIMTSKGKYLYGSVIYSHLSLSPSLYFNYLV